MSSGLTQDEQIAMLIVTFCNIGGVQTFFEMERDEESFLKKARISMNFTPPNSEQYLEPRQFLAHKQVQGKLKTGLFKADNKRYVEAHKQALAYIKEQGLMK